MEFGPDETAGQFSDGAPSLVASAFRSAWRGADDPATASVEMLPARLAKACTAVLPVDGAGLSLHQIEFRVPIGASDEMATLAERLQFTQGEGPCMQSAHTRRNVAVDAAEMEDRWPSFADELFRHTPYRAIASLPIAITPRTFAALDLYGVDVASVSALSLADVTAVTEQVAEALAAAVGASSQVERSDVDDDEALLPSWLDVEPARDRTYVWVAMGMVMSQFHVTATDSVALLRSFAYGHDRLIDEIAVDLVQGTLGLAQLQP